MRSLIEIYDPSSNFWELNPQMKTFGLFSELYKKDRSAKKNKSSKDMWMIAGICDKKSNYHDVAEDRDNPQGQWRMISRDLRGDENWMYLEKKRLEPYIEEYKKHSMTRTDHALERWHRRLQKRDKVLDETDYEVGITDSNGKLVGSNVADLDRMNINTPKLWDEYEKIQLRLSSEAEEGSSKGGTTPSAADLGTM